MDYKPSTRVVLLVILFSFLIGFGIRGFDLGGLIASIGLCCLVFCILAEIESMFKSLKRPDPELEDKKG